MKSNPSPEKASIKLFSKVYSSHDGLIYHNIKQRIKKIMWFVLSLFSCHTQSSWDSVSECLSLQKGEKKDDCLSIHGVELFEKNPKNAKKTIQEAISDPLIRDFIWLKVTREYNPATQEYCKEINNKALKERCITLVRRPHLHREKKRSSPKPLQ